MSPALSLTRRRLLAATSALVVPAGCLDDGPTVDRDGTGGMDVSFDLVDPRGSTLADVDGATPPEVATEGDRVVVTGALAVGSSSCKRARLAAVTYEEGTLRTVVVDGETGSHPDRRLFGGSCPDDYSVDAYRLVVSPGAALVRRVRAVERDVEGREVSVTRAVSGTDGA